MKKLLIVLLGIMMCLTLVGCSKQETPQVSEPKEEPTANMKNPVVTYESLDDVYKATGIRLISPGVMGKSDERFSVINDQIAQYEVTVGGFEYCLRGAKNIKDDISGLYMDGGNAFPTDEDYYAEDKTYKAYRFFLGDVQYCLSVKDEGQLDDETFANIFVEIYVDELYENSDKPFVDMVGYYQDATSQRAMAEVELDDINELIVIITWSSSATEYDRWYATIDKADGKAEYADMYHERVTVDENGKETIETLETNRAGYFEIVNGKIYWTGSGDASTETCVFEKNQ